MDYDFFESLLQKYKNRGILVDANLLLLYFVGSFNPALIPAYKRTKTYTVDDFAVLHRFIHYFDHLLTTPNILTEVSNLSTALEEHVRQEYFKKFKNMVTLLNEKVVLSKRAVANKCFEKYGLTDAVIVELSQKKYLVITDDFKLSNLLYSINIEVINFNHIRGYRWLRGKK
jgi:rRNA-processing protein FCF1